MRAAVAIAGSTRGSKRNSASAAAVPPRSRASSGRSASATKVEDFAKKSPEAPPSTTRTLSAPTTCTTRWKTSSAGRSSCAATTASTREAPGFANLWWKSSVWLAPGSSCRIDWLESTAPSAFTDTASGVTASVPVLLTVTRMPTSRSVPTMARVRATSVTATLRMDVGSGSVRQTTCGVVGSWAKIRWIVFQRSGAPRFQPTVCPSPMTTICLTALLPEARVTAEAVSAPMICSVPWTGLSWASVSRSTRLSEIGTGLSTCGTGPPRTMLKAVPRGASSMYF